MVEIHTWHWLAFSAVVAVLLILDLGVFHRHTREQSLRESAGWTLFWIALGLLFNVFIWWWLGGEAGSEFLTGYLIEKSLSMDNVFVFAVIFGYFQVPLKYQYHVLFWGILGAVVMRLAFILIGAEMVQRWSWMMPLFGLFLIYTGIKLAFEKDAEVHPDQNPVLRLGRKLLPVASTEASKDSAKFFLRENGRLCVTPLFLVLLVIESTDVIFAVDSVPAILGVVSKDAHYFQFVAFTSNVFAILGLRALYFLLAGMMNLFRYLPIGLAAILAFVGVKMILEYAAHHESWGGYIPHWLTWSLESRWIPLCVVFGLLGISVVASLVAQRRETSTPPPGEDQP